MDIQKIIENRESFEECEREVPLTHLEALTTLYESIGYAWSNSRELDGFVEFQDISVRRLLSETHHSESDFEYLLVSYKTVPFAVVYQTRNDASSSYHLLDKAVYLEVAKHLAAFLAEARVKELEREIRDEAIVTSLAEVPGNQVTWHSTEVGLFSFASPNELYGFNRSLERYAAVIQLDVGLILEVTKIHPIPHWKDSAHPQRHLIDVTTSDGNKGTVDSREILFFLVRPEDPVKAAQAAVHPRTEWKFTECVHASRHRIARCTQYQEGRIIGRRVSALPRELSDTVAFDAFVEKYREGYHAGFFQPENYGIDKV